MGEWRFEFQAQPSMPPLAWVAAVHEGVVAVDHGPSVRTFDGGFVEGTWAGSSDPAHIADSTTVFGTGMVLRDGQLLAIPPTHHLECIYFARVDDFVVVSNSLVGVLVAGGLELDPKVDYSSVFLGAVRSVWLIDDRHGSQLRLRHQQFEIPTSTVPVTGWYVENLAIGQDLSLSVQRRPREQPWTSFADYRQRLTDATRSLFANAPGYEPVVALSGGYDSSAVAAAAAAAGAARAVGFSTARPIAHATTDDDSGARTAATLGLKYVAYDRLGYRERSDLAEADFLATGMSGEDFVFATLEPELRHTMLLHGYWGGTEFPFADRHGWQHVSPITTSGADFTEFRLRNDVINVPLPLFGAIRTLDAPNLLDRAEMDPFRVDGKYDRPIPRRLAEEAGLKRGTFALAKRAVNVLPPREGLAAFTPAARASIERFAAAEGARPDWRPRRPFSRYERVAMRAARRMGITPVAERLARRQTSLAHFDPRLGNLLFRWAVSVVGRRYAAVSRPGNGSERTMER